MSPGVPDLSLLLQHPYLLRSFYEVMSGGGHSDDSEDEGHTHFCSCCAGSFESQTIKLITDFINPIITADHMEDARRYIKSKEDLEMEMRTILDALAAWYLFHYQLFCSIACMN